eukprot:4946942-Amphidinium_carterae.2
MGLDEVSNRRDSVSDRPEVIFHSQGFCSLFWIWIVPEGVHEQAAAWLALVPRGPKLLPRGPKLLGELQ